jgi:hypothetical protein
MATFNSYQITRNGSQIPLINSTSEIGYFSGNYFGSGWTSMGTFLTSNNGLATVSNSGLQILNPGIYRLTCSIDILSTANAGGPNTISIAFGTQNLTGQSQAGFFGGSPSSGMFNIGNNISNPGIINWTVTSYEKENSALPDYQILGTTTGFLAYTFYGKSNNSGSPYPSLYTTSIMFSIKPLIPGSSTIPTIYLNVSGTSLTLSRAYFVLELITTNTL